METTKSNLEPLLVLNFEDETFMYFPYWYFPYAYAENILEKKTYWSFLQNPNLTLSNNI
jgi:hypothetical protein